MPTNDETCTSDLRQYKCESCPGVHAHHPYRLWYERIPGSGRSRCYGCNSMKDPIPRGMEEGVLICYFRCSCDRRFTVQCRMEDTAPCYGCGAKEVKPLFFRSRERIRRMTDHTHNCSRCGGKGNCPNMQSRVAYCP